MPDRLVPPYRGVTDAGAFVDTPGDAAPPGAMVNVRIRTPGGERTTFGRRDPIVPAFAERLGDGPIQGLEVIPTARGTRYSIAGSSTDTSGESIDAAAIVGQCFVLDRQLSIVATFDDPYPDLDGDGSPPSDELVGWRGDWHPSDLKFGFSTLATKDYGGSIGQKVFNHVQYCDLSTREILWEKSAEDAPPGGSVGGTVRDLRACNMCVTAHHMLVCAGPYIQVYRLSDGLYIQRYQAPTWAWEFTDVLYDPRTPERLYCSFIGNPTIGGQVVGDTYNEGAHYRGGVLFTWLDDRPGLPVNTAVIGTVDSVWRFTGTYSENHGTLRLSELLRAHPRGRLPYSLAMGIVDPPQTSNGNRTRGPSPELVIGMTNQGFGPTTSFPPDGTTPYSTMCRVFVGGNEWPLAFQGDQRFQPNLLELADTNSRRDNWLSTGWLNDIPVDDNLDPIDDTAAGPQPSIAAVAFGGRRDSRGGYVTGILYYGAGKLAGGFNVYGLDANGGIAWSASTGGTVFRKCLVYDDVNNLLIACGERNNVFPGSGGAYACLWRFDPADGRLVDFIDIADDTWAFGVKVRNGRILLLTDHVPA